MAIITCPNCSRRISSKYDICPHCDEGIGNVDPDELERRARRRRKRLMFRARMTTFMAMTVFMIGLLWWWVDGELMNLDMPPPAPALSLMVLGIAVYLVSWSYIAWLRWRADQDQG